MKKMNDSVKYQLQRAEDALRTALTFSEKESVYVISAISKALIEIDNTMFAERIEAAAEQGDLSAQGLISIEKKEHKNGDTEFKFSIPGLDEYPYSSYISSGVRGGMSDDVITFG